MRRIVGLGGASAAAVCLGLGGAASPDAAGQSGAPPSTVNVDFLATTADGTPVADLSASQVTLRVDNKRRDIQSLTFVQLDNAATGTPVIPRELPFGTNVLMDAAHPARALVIAVEDESLDTGREKPMREAVAALVRSLSPRDRVAVIALPRGGLRTDFTIDHDRVIRVFDQITGQASRNDDARCRTRDTLFALTALLENLEGSQHPATVLFFSTGMVGPSQMTRPVTADGAPLVGTCLLLPDVFQQVGTAAERARANFYIVPPDTSPFGALLEGIENLAGVTAARRLGLVGAPQTALARIARETSGYYVATFAPDTAERDGLTHRLDVRVSRPGVTVRVRAAIPLPKSTRMTVNSGVARDLLKESRMHRELPLHVAAFASRQGAGQLGIIALAEPAEAGVTLTSAAVGLYDAKDQLIAQWSAPSEELTTRPLQAGLVAPPGTYRVRGVAIDTFGRRGTADYMLDAALARAGSLQLSSLVVGLSRDGKFVPRLTFGGEASAMAMLEIYGGVAGAAVGALLEISDTANGAPFVTSRLVLEATSEPDRFIARGLIPIGALPPGDFVVRAILEAQGQPAGRVLRAFRKISTSAK